MLRFCILIFVILFTSEVQANIENHYHKVSANKGDGVYSLLRRYELVDEPCNIRQFYKLNSLQKNDPLIKGKKYYIPVLIYNYNGQSIRSTIKNEDWDKAIEIQKYNERLLSKGLRKSSYTESKLLWVPFSSIYCSNKEEEQIDKEIPEANVVKSISEKAAEQLSKGGSNNISEVAEIRSEESIKAEVKKPEILKTEEKPKTKVVKNYKSDPLFGAKLASYEEVDRSLSDRVFYIVAGHGGPDPGAMCTTCPSTLCEDEYAYDVALRLARNLKQHGANVEIIIQDKNDGIRSEKYLTCDKDEKCIGNKTIPLNQKARLAQRTNAINSLYKDYKAKGFTDQTVVVIHVDARSSSKRQDVFFYHHENSKRGKKIAENIQTTFREKYERFQKSRGYRGTVKSRGLYIIRNTLPPTVFIELANIKNPKDQKRLIIESNRQALANWIFLGLIRK